MSWLGRLASLWPRLWHRGLLFFYGLNFHHLAPNYILHIATFITFNEAFLHYTHKSYNLSSQGVNHGVYHRSTHKLCIPKSGNVGELNYTQIESPTAPLQSARETHSVCVHAPTTSYLTSVDMYYVNASRCVEWWKPPILICSPG